MRREKYTAFSKDLLKTDVNRALISFTPWIIYWFFAVRGKAEGIFCALFISFFLWLFDYWKDKVNIVNTLTLVFFLLAFIITFILKYDFMIKTSGFISYFIFGLIGIASLFFKLPFTLTFSEIYKKDKIVIDFHYHLSVIWIIAYILNSIFFLFLSDTLGTILSITTLILAFFTSLIFAKNFTENIKGREIGNDS